jgi:hypothetical protein
MAKTIPQLTDATTVNAADELIIQQGGITKRATGAELARGLNAIGGTVNIKDFGVIGDGLANDTAAFAVFEASNQGVRVDLRGATYNVTSEPTGAIYYNGAFKIGSSLVYKDATPWPTPFGRASVKAAISANDAHYGFNNGIVEVGTGTSSKWVLIYRKANVHGLADGSQVWAADSYDHGQTWYNHRLVYRTAPFDTRNFVVAKMASNRIGVLASRRDETTAYGDAVFIYSDDAGVTWSSATITSPTSGMAVNFHGAMLSYPTAAGGNDTNGFIAFSYANNRSVDAFYTTDNGATWTVDEAVAAPDVATLGGTGLTYSLSEMGVARLGNENKWLMVLRNSDNAGGADSDAVAYTSTNLTTWSGPVDTGLLLRGNPPQLIYEGGRFWFFAFSRSGREILSGHGAHLLVASAPASALFSNGGNFAALNSGWQVVTPVADWASGYMHAYKIANKWVASFVSQEQPSGGTSGPKRNVLSLIGDFSPTVIGVNEVLSLVPFRNEVINGGFNSWSRGASFALSGTTQVPTSDMWWGNAASAETMTLTRESFTLGQKEVEGDPRFYVRVTGTAAAAPTHAVSTRIYGVQRVADQRVTLSLWAKGTALHRIRLNYVYGTGGSPSATTTFTVAGSGASVVAYQTIPMSNTWRKLTYTFNTPSVAGTTLGTDNNDYAQLLIYPDATTYTTDIANVKLEKTNTATPIVIESQQEVAGRAGLFADSLQGYTAVIAAGAITVASTPFVMSQFVDTEAAAATDDLDTINGGQEGQVIMLATTTSARDVVFKDGTGNLLLAGDFTATASGDLITLIKRGSNWVEVSRSDNA